MTSIGGIALLLTGPVSGARARRAETWDADANRAVQALRKEDAFAIGGVGIAGRMSSGEEALRVLLKHRQGVSAFKYLLNNAGRVGQLYSLLGLKIKAPAEYARIVGEYRSSKETVKTFAGCIGGMDTVGRIVARIDADDYKPILSREPKKPGK